jgi:LmbE family N-acetylglucosaminyl deacetylase
MTVVILSPHLDDAALSCWHLLTAPGEVLVINVFAGVPASLDGPAWWDRYTGATDSAQRVRERLQEDRRALALAGRTAVHLDLLDEQYRESGQPLGPLTAQIERLLPSGAGVYAPAAMALHADHALVRAAALELRARGFAVSLYADLPHATVHGWPGWVTGSHSATPQDLAGAMWDRALAGTTIPPEEMAPTVHVLGAKAHSLKLEAVHTYATQLQGLVEFAGRPLTDRETLGYEVVWKLPSATTGSPVPAGDRAAPGP